MNVIVDTAIWSLALRRSTPVDHASIEELKNLIADRRARLIGPIRQEVLSGIREAAQFDRLRERLAAFPDLSLTEEDFVTAARFFNSCRARGVQGSSTDFLICSVSVNHRLSVYTTDQDFLHYQKHLPIRLHPMPVA